MNFFILEFMKLNAGKKVEQPSMVLEDLEYQYKMLLEFQKIVEKAAALSEDKKGQREALRQFGLMKQEILFKGIALSIDAGTWEEVNK